MSDKNPNKRGHIKSSESFINEKKDSKKPELEKDLISDSDSDSNSNSSSAEKEKFTLLKDLKLQQKHAIFKVLVVEKQIINYINKKSGLHETLVKLKLMDSERNYINAIIYNNVINQIVILENVSLFVLIFHIKFNNYCFKRFIKFLM